MLSILTPLLFLGSTDALPSIETTTVCDELFARYPQYLAYDTLGPSAIKSALNAFGYASVNMQYWNKENSDHRSACTFMPASAEHVADAVQLLHQYPNVQFALKGGGHNPGPGFNAVHEGVLIAFEANLGSTITSRTPDGTHFIVGPGARWGDVYQFTGQTQQVVVGGRLAHVGVGGFLLGGICPPNTYNSSRPSRKIYANRGQGFGCDNVDLYEAVLANGTIVYASREEHPDLFWALRGGGNQFAIVTRFWLRAHPEGSGYGMVWGGMRAFTPDRRLDVMRAVTRFTRDYPDAKAAIIPTFQFGLPGNILNIITGPILLMFYDGPMPPPGIFDELNQITPMIDTTKTRRYADIVTELFGADFTGFSQSFRVATFPNLPEDETVAFLDFCYNTTYAMTLNTDNLDIQVAGFDPQPMSARIQAASQAAGGNCIGLDANQGDKLWFELNHVWANPMCSTACPQASAQLADAMMAYHQQYLRGIPPTHYVSGDIYTSNYNPLFMNDAAPDQDVYSSYGSANLQRLLQIKQSYDPYGFLTTRQNGFKLPGSQPSAFQRRSHLRSKTHRHNHRPKRRSADCPDC